MLLLLLYSSPLLTQTVVTLPTLIMIVCYDYVFLPFLEKKRFSNDDWDVLSSSLAHHSFYILLQVITSYKRCFSPSHPPPLHLIIVKCILLIPPLDVSSDDDNEEYIVADDDDDAECSIWRSISQQLIDFWRKEWAEDDYEMRKMNEEKKRRWGQQ